MKIVITNEQGKLEEIRYAEDKSAWVYGGLAFALVLGAAFGGWLFCFGG